MHRISQKIAQGKMRDFLALVFYVLFIVMLMFDLPLALGVVCDFILMFIPIFLISKCIISSIMVGEPANQTSINASFYEAPICNSILIIIIGPILEEFVFRFLPYRFIKNKTLYIIVSTVVFAAMHVINDTDPFYYIWFYMMTSLYYGYRYHKTKDIWVTISIHSLNNLIATLLFIFS